MLLRWLATAALLRPNSIGSLKSWSTCGEGRGSTGQASCVLQCSGNEPVLDQFLRPWAHQEYLLPFHALDQYCDPATVRTLSAAVAVTNSSIFWKKCHADGEDTGCMDPVANEDTRLWLRVLLEVLQVVRIDGALFIVQCGDDPNVPSDQEPFPVFHSEGGAGVWNVPWLNPYHLKALFQGELDDRTAPARVPWAQKKPVVYWRGALTAPDNIPVSEAQHLPRFRVFQVAQLRKELFDVGVSSIDDELIAVWGKKAVQKLLKQNRVRRTPHEDFAEVAPRYRYLLNLNGVVSSWRLSQLLRTGSVLLLQRSPTHEALHWELVEWKHYVPVSASLDDLVEVVTTLEGNETLAKEIAEAGADFYARRMRPEDAYCIALRTLEISQLPEVTPQMLASRGFVRAPGLEALSSHTSAESAPSTLRERIESRLEL
eukprot:s4995_g3.t1